MNSFLRHLPTALTLIFWPAALDDSGMKDQPAVDIAEPVRNTSVGEMFPSRPPSPSPVAGPSEEAPEPFEFKLTHTELPYTVPGSFPETSTPPETSPREATVDPNGEFRFNLTNTALPYKPSEPDF